MNTFAVVHLMDSRFAVRLEADETYAYTENGIVITHPDRKPKLVQILGDTASIREISLADAHACSGKVILTNGRPGGR